MLKRLRRMFGLEPIRVALPRIESTRPELIAFKAGRKIEQARTDRIARILDDYRAQDRLLRR